MNKKFDFDFYEVNKPWGSVPTLHLSRHANKYFNSIVRFDDPGGCPVSEHPLTHNLTTVKANLAKLKAEQEEAKKKEDEELEKQTEEYKKEKQREFMPFLANQCKFKYVSTVL
jgi:hypothetical protein